MDEDGSVFCWTPRQYDQVSGFRINPTEVEEVLFQSAMVREAAVIGVPDEALGQIIKAYVAFRDGKEVRSDTLLSFCAEKMPRYMVPKSIEVLDALPKTPSGKIDYPALRHRAGSL